MVVSFARGLVTQGSALRDEPTTEGDHWNGWWNRCGPGCFFSLHLLHGIKQNRTKQKTKHYLFPLNYGLTFPLGNFTFLKFPSKRTTSRCLLGPIPFWNEKNIYSVHSSPVGTNMLCLENSQNCHNRMHPIGSPKIVQSLKKWSEITSIIWKHDSDECFSYQQPYTLLQTLVLPGCRSLSLCNDSHPWRSLEVVWKVSLEDGLNRPGPS